MKRVGLFIGRLQPLHMGHSQVIFNMIEYCETAIIGLGSTQLNKEKENPWNVEERKQMLKNVFGERIKIVPLKDLGTEPGKNAWIDYVLEKINKVGLPEPTDYFTGSEADSIWYRDRFHYELDVEFNNHYINGTKRQLHILERSNNNIPSATEIRGFLETRDEGWKKWVPRVNHEIVELGYPEEFKVPDK